MKVHLSVALVALAAAASLAACGGGGSSPGFQPPSAPSSQPSSPSSPSGSTAPSSNPSTNPNPSPTSQSTSPPVTSGSGTIDTMPAVSQPNGQMNQAQQALGFTGMTGTLSAAGNALGTGPVSVFSTARTINSVVRHRFGSAATCTNSQIVQQTTQSNGLEAYVVFGYASNSNCQGTPEYELQLAVSNGSNGYVGSGYATFYNSNDVMTGENTISYLSVSKSATLLQGEFTTPTAAVSSAYGARCDNAGCSAGSVVNFNVNKEPGIEFGAVISSVGTAAPTVNACANYPNDLTLAYNNKAATPPYFQINGCATNDTVTMTQTGASSYSLFDTTVGAEVDVTTNSDGSITGYVYAYTSATKGAQLASFSTDQYGNGTITTSDSIPTPIADFMVI